MSVGLYFEVLRSCPLQCPKSRCSPPPLSASPQRVRFYVSVFKRVKASQTYNYIIIIFYSAIPQAITPNPHTNLSNCSMSTKSVQGFKHFCPQTNAVCSRLQGNSGSILLTSVDLDVGSLGSMENVQTIFELLSCSVEHVRCNIWIRDFRSSSPLTGVRNTMLLT
jgi:hypothetical protein